MFRLNRDSGEKAEPAETRAGSGENGITRSFPSAAAEEGIVSAKFSIAGPASGNAPTDPRIPPAGNLATGTLKVIALVFMLCDHLGAAVFPQIPEMRILGRIAFPLYCWCIVVGFHFTRSVPKYLGRILLTGFISQPIYAVAMNHMGPGAGLGAYFLGKANIFLTLALALAGLWGIREKKYLSQIWGPAVVICLATVLKVDYGWRGVAFVMLLYLARTSRASIAALMTAFFLFWGTSYGVTQSFFGMPVNLNSLPEFLSQPLSSLMRLETYGLFSLPFILIPFRKNLRMPHWVGYGLYPAHLIVVQLVKMLVWALAG